MELLLFLSALLTGLTGVISGERKAEPAQMQRSAAEVAVNVVAEMSAETTAPALHASVLPFAPMATLALAAPLWAVHAVTAPQDPRRVSERRLE